MGVGAQRHAAQLVGRAAQERGERLVERLDRAVAADDRDPEGRALDAEPQVLVALADAPAQPPHQDGACDDAQHHEAPADDVRGHRLVGDLEDQGQRIRDGDRERQQARLARAVEREGVEGRPQEDHRVGAGGCAADGDADGADRDRAGQQRERGPRREPLAAGQEDRRDGERDDGQAGDQARIRVVGVGEREPEPGDGDAADVQPAQRAGQHPPVGGGGEAVGGAVAQAHRPL